MLKVFTMLSYMATGLCLTCINKHVMILVVAELPRYNSELLLRTGKLYHNTLHV